MSVINLGEVRYNKMIVELGEYIADTSELFDMHNEKISKLKEFDNITKPEIERIQRVGEKFEIMGLELSTLMTEEQHKFYLFMKDNSRVNITEYQENRVKEIEAEKMRELEQLVKALKELYSIMPMLEELTQIDKITYEIQDGVTGTFNELDEEAYIFLAPNLEYDELLLTLANIWGTYIYHANVYEEAYTIAYAEIFNDVKKAILEEKGIDIEAEEHDFMDSQADILGLFYEMFLALRKGIPLNGFYMISEPAYNKIYNKFIPIITGVV